MNHNKGALQAVVGEVGDTIDYTNKSRVKFQCNYTGDYFEGDELFICFSTRENTVFKVHVGAVGDMVRELEEIDGGETRGDMEVDTSECRISMECEICEELMSFEETVGVFRDDFGEIVLHETCVDEIIEIIREAFDDFDGGELFSLSL